MWNHYRKLLYEASRVEQTFVTQIHLVRQCSCGLLTTKWSYLTPKNQHTKCTESETASTLLDSTMISSSLYGKITKGKVGGGLWSDHLSIYTVASLGNFEIKTNVMIYARWNWICRLGEISQWNKMYSNDF